MRKRPKLPPKPAPPEPPEKPVIPPGQPPIETQLALQSQSDSTKKYCIIVAVIVMAIFLAVIVVLATVLIRGLKLKKEIQGRSTMSSVTKIVLENRR